MKYCTYKLFAKNNIDNNHISLIKFNLIFSICTKKQYGYSNYGSLYKESEQSLRIHGVIALSFVSLMSERY